MAHVRDRPSLRESVEITTPSGNRYRWADDEDNAANVPSGERFTDTMPGGFAEHDAVLPRKPAVDYADLERLSTITRYDASGGIIWQGRLERAPKVSGDQIAISPSAVGWQAHLEDDKSVVVIYRDIDFTRWGPIPSDYRIVLLATYSKILDASQSSTPDTTSPSLMESMEFDGTTSAARPYVGAAYDSRGARLGQIYGAWLSSNNWTPATNRFLRLSLGDNATGTGGTDNSGDIEALSGNSTVTATMSTRRVAIAEWFWNAAAVAGTAYDIYWTTLAVYGDHGLTNRGTEPTGGFYDADIIEHALGQWCPLINTAPESFSASAFIIPQMAFLEPTTVSEIVRQATRFGLRDWAVWDGPTFWLHDRGARGTAWRARVGPSGLEETGLQVDRLWESVVVAYQDVDGSTRTVGPVGSGADTETDDLKDDDPDNPANKLGITRRDMLSMGISTAAGATEVGRRFLEETKALDSSGRARITGHVQDSSGVWHPYSHMRSGDTITFVDASDTSARRIVRTDKSRDDRSCSIDLDSPPEGLQALLERLGVVLVPLGI